MTDPDPDPVLHFVALTLAVARGCRLAEAQGVGLYWFGDRFDWRRVAEGPIQ